MTDFASIIEGGFSNIVDNADKFMEYPGQSKLNSVKELGQGFSAADSLGYNDINDLDLSEFSGSDQTYIRDTLSGMDTLSTNTTTCSDIVQGFVDSAVNGFMNAASILDSYKSQNGITECTYGLETLLSSEPLLDDYLGKTDTSQLTPAYNRLKGGINLRDIAILDSIMTAMDGMCEILKNAFLALVNLGVAILEKAVSWLSNFGLLGRLTSDPCVTALMPDEASEYIDDISNNIKGIETPVVEDLLTPPSSLISDVVTTPASVPLTPSWINSSVVLNEVKTSSDRGLYSTISNKIDRFVPSTAETIASTYQSIEMAGSPIASVPDVTITRTSLSYNESTGRWE